MASDTIWTQQVRLEEITKEEFRTIEPFWGNYANIPFLDETYARIFNPVVEKSYEDLIQKFCAHPLALRLNVRGGKHWYHIPKRGISPEIASNIAQLAYNDKLQTNHFEMKFQSYQQDAYGAQQRALISFARKGNSIIGYKVRVHRKNRGLFDCRIESPFPFISAIYRPE